jgi:hypothetical protein
MHLISNEIASQINQTTSNAFSRGLSAMEQQALKNVSNGNRASLCNTKEAHGRLKE